jgi:hypothetical protein
LICGKIPSTALQFDVGEDILETYHTLKEGFMYIAGTEISEFALSLQEDIPFSSLRHHLVTHASNYSPLW